LKHISAWSCIQNVLRFRIYLLWVNHCVLSWGACSAAYILWKGADPLFTKLSRLDCGGNRWTVDAGTFEQAHIT
jgi:hypothetical protein